MLVKFLKEFYRATNPNPKKIWVFYWIRFFKQNKFGIFAARKNGAEWNRQEVKVL